ncbi:hypothetical protein QQ045_029984 [Rhodiola kirilowii]
MAANQISETPAPQTTQSTAVIRPPEAVSVIDDPLFVSNSENFSVPLVTQPSVGVNNYITWKRSMEMVLGIKSKQGFVQGRFPKPSDPYQLTRWERCNNVILSWIINSVSKEIASSIIHCNDCIHAWNTLQMRFA